MYARRLTHRARILTFIITMLLLAADFYYTKNIAGRRLVGLRWWNEVDPAGESRWVFESSESGTKVVNATDSRFFWLAMYVQPVVWVVMAIVALFRLQFLWVPLVGMCPCIPLSQIHPLRLA